MVRPWILLLAVLGLAGPGGRASAQDASLPAQLQVSFFTRILSFDQALSQRVEEEVVVGVLFQERYRTSFLVKDELLAAVEAES